MRSGANDPRLLALHVEVLLGLGQRDQAQPLVRQLWASGYRDLAVLDLLQREHIDYPPNADFQQSLQALAGCAFALIVRPCCFAAALQPTLPPTGATTCRSNSR